eukprot:3638603-Rhodomonas_salina.1
MMMNEGHGDPELPAVTSILRLVQSASDSESEREGGSVTSEASRWMTVTQQGGGRGENSTVTGSNLRGSS